ncbi:hypothetical protein E6R18_04850 [Streptomyces sp. A1277]|uniref:phosphatase PAP2 family protein n=1 Tax=Streptomyces sp. A1277 TaxID=2563103 RepID=UPI0010A234BB|nr:hypothetical protein [Streptomyces sp. A1277]THA35057.1 hypothetical protein E6R18_04850 [Streptomyces sp. A1277]
MTTSTTSVGSRSAELASDLFGPLNWTLFVILLMGWHADGLVGIGWSLFAILFTIVLPLMLIAFGVRRGFWTDAHFHHRQDRLTALPALMACVLTGTALMHALQAPSELTALIGAMTAGVVVILTVTTVWKISVHTAVATGAATTLALAYGLPALALLPLIAVTGWSRVKLQAHTPAQVVVGFLLSTLVSGSVFTALR